MYIMIEQSNIEPILMIFGWLGAVLGLAGSLLAPKPSGGGYSMPPEREKSEYENYLESFNKGNYGTIGDFWKQSISDYQKNYNDTMNGVLPDSFKKNITEGMRAAVDETSGRFTSQLAKTGALGSSAYDRDRYNLDKNITSNYAQQYSGNLQMLAGLSQNKAQIAGDWLKYPQQAWQTETTLRRGTNTANYKPDEPSPLTGLFNTAGSMFGGGMFGSSGGQTQAYNPNFFGGLNSSNAWGNASW